MNDWLAQMYNTNDAGAEVQEEQAKLANLELFAKLAAKHNIDLSQLSDTQVQELYAETFPEEVAKQAASEEKEEKEEAKDEKKEEKKEEKDDEGEGKKEKAMEYFGEKKAFQEKFAEADLMGRVMAHSFMQEKGEIEKAAAAAPPATTTDEPVAPAAAPAPAPTAPAAAPAVPAPTTEKTAGAEQFEELAATQGIKIAEAAGYNTEQAQARITAVHTLGLQETEKVAAVKTGVEDALHIRGLEYLEAAGYPVDWSQVYEEKK